MALTGEAKYEELIERYEQSVFNIVSRLVNDPSDAAGAVQQVFLKVFRNVESLGSESALKTQIYRIAVNEARNRRRQVVRSWFVRSWFFKRLRRAAGSNCEPSEPYVYESPPAHMVDEETQILIEEALRTVAPKFRAALVLREIEGLSYEEISRILDVSVDTARLRILRGREALSEQMARHPRLTLALAESPQLAD